MSVSFRIKTAQGQELSFASREMFVEFIRSGDLAESDLVYDAESKGWSPARTHPLVLEIQYEAEAEEEAAEDGAGEAKGADETAPAGGDEGTATAGDDVGPTESEEIEETPAADAAASSDSSFGLELAPAMEGPTPEEQAEAFKAQMESERAQEMEFDARDTGISGFTMETTGSLADMIAPEPEPPPPPPPPPPPQQRPAPAKAAAPRRSEPRREREESRKAPARPKPTKKGGAGKKVALAILVIALLGVGAFFGRDFLPVGTSDDPTEAPVVEEPEDLTIPVAPEPEPEPEPEPTIASTEEAVRERAQERFLSATQALLRELEPISPDWLTGPYVALPSDYDAIRETWVSYRDVIRAIRGTDADRYRTAYELALTDAAVPEENRPDRLALAMTAFEPNAAAADEHWGRAVQLASAAIQSHDALVEAEGLILYDASGATGRGPGLAEGASGRDSDAQLLLDQVVDAIRDALNGGGQGPRTGENVREWLWGGFLDSVTR